MSRIQSNGAASGQRFGVLVGPATGTSPGATDSVFEDIDDVGSGVGLYVTAAQRTTFRRITSTDAGVYSNNTGGIHFDHRVSAIDAEDLVVLNPAVAGIQINATLSTFRRLRVTGSPSEGGIALSNQGAADVGNRLADVRIATNDGTPAGSSRGLYLNAHGIRMQDVNVSNTDQAVVVSSFVTNARVANVYASGGDNLIYNATDGNGGGVVLQNVTAAGARLTSSRSSSRGAGVWSNSVSQKYMGNLLTFNTERGLLVTTVGAATGAPARFRNAVLVGSEPAAVLMQSTSPTSFEGELRLGNEAAVGLPCTVAAGATGLSDTCTAEAPSTATVTTGYLDTDVVVGPVTADSVNAGDVAGQATFAESLDFMTFENSARSWGRTGAGTWPGLDQRGLCQAGGTCQIFDYSLLATDSTARGITPVPTGDDVVTVDDPMTGIATPSAQADCDTHAPGSVFTAGTPNRCLTTFLADAYEPLFDGLGDDDTLCESGETCVYSPNAGAYQGHGALVSAGTFSDGAITGVTMLRYETNGR
ncbi:MAG: hypothetical protein FJ104_04610 [Deltaproteobacteria bacterium]|nr:hypothetical protein [Deltaproteobacteria bacterium]